tara:strand:+ start:454 stop:729 length:276 start_codon:yes stop_codon:yes gene_type:complete
MGSIRDTSHKDVRGMRTICEVHREIYDILAEEMPERKDIINRLEEAYGMAKKMDRRLRYYAEGYDDDWWEKQSKKESDWRHELRQSRKKER